MYVRRVADKLRKLCLPLALLLGVQGTVFGQEGCDHGCQRHNCPPPFKHCMEGPPCLCFKKGCPRPVCPPGCDTPNWGYYQPCWRPWPWPPDWSHCPYQVPAATIAPCPHAPTGAGTLGIPGDAPTPRRLEMNGGPGL
jgi:hypothetical protein